MWTGNRVAAALASTAMLALVAQYSYASNDRALNREGGETAPAARAAPKTQGAERAQLRATMEQILTRPALLRARVGVHVVAVDTGEVVFSHEGEELLNPASNVKLFTSAAALARLGPEYRFATEFACIEMPKKGVCPKLYIRGRGDPSLYTERIYGIAGELVHRGLKGIGDIVVDDTYFDGEREGPGWEQERSDKPYMAPAGALSINHNAVAIYVSPGEADKAKARVELEPMSDYLVLANSVLTVPRRSRRRVEPSSYPQGDKQRIVVGGRLPAGRETLIFYKKIDNPPMYAGETFKTIFKERGIPVKGKVKLGTMPEDTVSLYTSYSPALAEIVRELNKVSNNFVAEQLLKATGAEMRGPPGTWAKGVSAVEEYLAEIGIPKGSFVMKNGSGLNDTNRFSPAQITRLLSAVELQSGFFPEFSSSLGIAGRDGTIRSRMEGSPAAGRLRGKTGTLENVTALSGYVRTASGHNYAYSILVNDFETRHGPAVSGVDALATAIASGGVAEPEEPAAAVADAFATTSELRARVATFANLGKVADKRNLPFLRSALRTERDPVLRAVVADAIYRSDPEFGVPGLLENVPAAPETFAKLRALGQDLSLPTPLVSSLIDVAAEGNADALDKLLGLASQSQDDETNATVLADGLQEIGRTAPDELFAALKRATDEIAEGSLSLLERGIAGSEERVGHPFLARLKTPVGAAVAQPAAMAMLERITKAMVEAAKPPAPALDVQPLIESVSGEPGEPAQPGGG